MRISAGGAGLPTAEHLHASYDARYLNESPLRPQGRSSVHRLKRQKQRPHKAQKAEEAPASREPLLDLNSLSSSPTESLELLIVPFNVTCQTLLSFLE